MSDKQTPPPQNLLVRRNLDRTNTTACRSGIQASIKVRLGFVNTAGQQKGVDSLIVTDMITLARNRVMCDAVLLSGDEDIRVGVQQAQEFGVRVHLLLGIAPCRGSRSRTFLLQEADTTHEWGKKDISAFLSHNQMPLQTAPLTIPTLPPSLAVNPAPASPGTLDDLAMEWLTRLTPT